LLGRSLAALPQLRRLTLSGFAACSEAALSAASAATALTYLDLSAPLNRVNHSRPLDFAQLAALRELRALRMLNVDPCCTGRVGR
jgi:hypothetical protein